MMLWNSLTGLGKRVVGIGALVVALIVVVLTLAWCDARKDAREARGEAKMSEGRTQSGADAIEKIGELRERGAATDQEVKEAVDAIRKVEPGPERERVARYQLCVVQQRAGCDRLLGVGAHDPQDADAAR